MKQKIKEEMETIKKALPLMSDFQRGEFAGAARTVLEYQKAEVTDGEKDSDSDR